MRRYKDHLLVREHTPEQPKAQAAVVWALPSTVTLSDGSQWRATKQRGQGIDPEKLDTLAIVFRKGGERCRRAGDKGARLLKKYLQEQGIPSWERAQIPLFYAEKSLVGVGDLFVCEGWQVKDPNKEGWIIEKVI